MKLQNKCKMGLKKGEKRADNHIRCSYQSRLADQESCYSNKKIDILDGISVLSIRKDSVRASKKNNRGLYQRANITWKISSHSVQRLIDYEKKLESRYDDSLYWFCSSAKNVEINVANTIFAEWGKMLKVKHKSNHHYILKHCVKCLDKIATK